MTIPLPKTKGQWIAAIVAIGLVLLALYFFTDTFKGRAVEVSLENAGQRPVFAYLDNTGRHGKDTATVKLKTPAGGETKPGLLIQPGTSRSFGAAVGLGDSPTLHVMPVEDNGTTVSSTVNDCPFDTIGLKKLELPSLHVRIKWTGKCEVQPQ